MTANKKDITEKKLMAYNDVFAGIFNSLVFYGTGLVIDPDDLEDARVRSVYVPLSDDDNSLREQERDIAKFWKKEGVILCLMGLENQTVIDRHMALRIMGYEGADYRFQITERDEALRAAKRKGDVSELQRIKSRKFYPVITAVLYYGIKRRWDKYKSLRESLDIPAGLENLVEDRHINVIELAWLSDDEMNRLKGDAWLLADALRQMRMYGEYRNEDITAVEHVEAMLMFLTEFTGRKNLFKEGLLKYEEAQREGRQIAMVDLFGASYRAGVTDGHAEGITIGRSEGITIGRNEGITIGRNEERAESLEFSVRALQGLGVSPEIIERYTSLYNSRPDGKPHIED